MSMSKRKREEEEEAVPDEEDEEEQHRRMEAEDDEIQRRLQQRRSEESARMGELYDNFVLAATPEQLERFEQWKRSNFSRKAMIEVMEKLVGNKVANKERNAIVLCAVAKMFVGDLVEGAREIMDAAGETGPIQPTHLRQAHRQAERRGRTRLGAPSSSRLFWRPDCGA
jgi:transcription initiation factor TFIID subunit 11